MCRLLLAPDGRFLAFDLPTTEARDQRDIFTMAVDGSRETPVTVAPGNDRLMGWSSSGQLLFASDRNGSVDLWAVTMAAGDPAGAPVVVKPAIGTVNSLGVAADGTLFTTNIVSTSDVQVIAADLPSGAQLEAASQPIETFVGTNSMPAWSRDGRFLAYLSTRPDLVVFGIRSLESGAVRELRPGLRYVSSFSWSPDGRSFAVAGADSRGRQGVYVVDAGTGATEPIVLTPLDRAFNSYGPQWSPDGSRLYFRRNLATGGRAFYEFDLASRAEREVVRGDLGALSVSPDGRWLATTDQWTDDTGNAYAVLLVSIDTGQVRELHRPARPHTLFVSPLAWIPDGTALIVRKLLADCGARLQCPSQLLRVPISGAAPVTIDVDVTRSILGYTGVAVHPDGRRLAFVAGQQRHEVWALHHFLPPAAARQAERSER